MARYVPHAKQKPLHVSRKRFKNVVAGRRAGKSKSMGRETARRIVMDQADSTIPKGAEPRQYWCVAPTEELTGIQLRELRAAFAEVGIGLEFNRSEMGARIPGWDVWIRFRSSRSIEQLVGEDIWGLWWDEASKSRDEAWGYLEPCLSATGGWVLTSTTPEGQNWYYESFWRRGDPLDELHDPRYENFHFVSADNPFLARVCPTCRESYRAGLPPWKAGRCPADGTELVPEAAWKKAFLPARVYQREYLASFTAFVGQIWEELDPATHWRELPPGMAFRRLIGGQDWNYALPGVYLLGGEDVQGQWWILGEISAERLPVWDEKGDCWVSRIRPFNEGWERRTHAAVEAIFADPAMPEHIETERRKGLPARRADNAVSLGIQTVATLAHPIPGRGPRLFFACERRNGALVPYAREAWKQWVAYRFRPGSEEPLKESDHACDAGRYLLHSAAGKARALGMGQGRVM